MIDGNVIRIPLILICIVVLPACEEKDPESKSGSHIYTLYRGGALDKSMRMQFALFPTKGEKAEWNKENCEKISDHLNETQKHVSYPVKFWCEKGEFSE